jgi:uncharacterized protein (TIGR03086 family)
MSEHGRAGPPGHASRSPGAGAGGPSREPGAANEGGSSDVADRYRRLARGFTDRVEAVPEDRWENPSPCAGWTARDVVRHMVETSELFLGMVGLELPAGPSVDDDPVGAWASACGTMQAALDNPEKASLPYEGRFGRTTLEQGVGRFVCADLVVHTWDLARATGLDERLDPDDVHELLVDMEPMDEIMRESGAFGPKLEPPAGADEQTRLLAFLGRAV